jgi:hypothetical protein
MPAVCPPPGHPPIAEVCKQLVASDDLTNLLRREADIAVRMVRPAQGSLVVRRVFEFLAEAIPRELQSA